jgi:hypothetical protein
LGFFIHVKAKAILERTEDVLPELLATLGGTERVGAFSAKANDEVIPELGFPRRHLVDKALVADQDGESELEEFGVSLTV